MAQFIFDLGRRGREGKGEKKFYDHRPTGNNAGKGVLGITHTMMTRYKMKLRGNIERINL